MSIESMLFVVDAQKLFNSLSITAKSCKTKISKSGPDIYEWIVERNFMGSIWIEQIKVQLTLFLYISRFWAFVFENHV